MKRILTVFILSVICFLKVLPQETKIIGIIDGAHQNNDALRVVTFDYVSSVCDTLLSINDNFWVTDFATAIDLQRGLIYFMEQLTACGPDPQTVYALNIQSQKIDTVGDLGIWGYSDIYALFYDMFNHRLIYRDRSRINSYDLTTGEKKVICSLDFTLMQVWGSVTTYNPITNKLLFISAKPIGDTINEYSVLIDISKGIIEKTLKLDREKLIIEGLTCDVLNNKYYATNIVNDSIIEYDPQTGQVNNIASACLNNWAHLDTQVAVFDYYSQKYITPLYDESYKTSYLDLVNITDNSSTCISFQKAVATNDHHLFSGKDIFLKLEDNNLIASKCDSYNWYLNGVEILNANTQFLSPPQSGFYKYSTNIGGEIYFSNEILYQPLGVNSQIEDNEIQIYPNPVTDELNIIFPLTFTGSKTIIMYDLYGTIVFSAKPETLKSSHKIIAPPGIYYLKIITDDHKVSTKKVIVI